jgi:NADH-quinone oxidoreductase subunit A
MQSYYLEYNNTLLFLGLSIALGIILMALSFFLSRKRTLDVEKLSAYECGFDPFGDCRTEFNIHFYLIGILFIIFDLEVVLLFPWAVSVGSLEPFAI